MWHTQTASVIGRGHLRVAMPCQDRTWTLQKNGVTAIAVADGAGSAILSQEGAACAVEAACRVLCGQFEWLVTTATPMEMRRAVLDAVTKRIRERAQELGCAEKDMACTLLTVAVCGDSYLVFHVGDGVIGYQKEGKVCVASAPVNGEFSNTTTFVTSRDALLKAKVLRGNQPKLEGFVLMSDGCEAALYAKGRKRLAPLVSRLFQRAELLRQETATEQLKAVLSTVIARRTQDDCSLAILSRKSEQFGYWDKLTQRERAAVLGVTTGNRNHRRRQIRRYAAEYGAICGK